MRIKWYGHAAFGLFPGDGPKTMTDPYTPETVGYAPIGDPADLVIISSADDDAHCRADLIAGNPQVVNALKVADGGGTLETLGISISAIEVCEWEDHPDHAVPGRNGMYRFTLDGINCAHMGDVGNRLSDEQEEFFSDVDILFALAGGHLTIDLPDLMEMIHRMRPKLVIPMHFRTLAYQPRNTLWIESFLMNFREDDIEFACSSEVDVSRGQIPDRTRVLVMDYVR